MAGKKTGFVKPATEVGAADNAILDREIVDDNEIDLDEIIAKGVRPETRDELKKIIELAVKEKGVRVDLNFIDTSLIKNMTKLFLDSKFNGDISKWDVSRVTDFNSTFKRSKFNGDISKWDMSSAVGLQAMFFKSEFNQDISKWRLINAKYLVCIFLHSKFTGDITEWRMPKTKLKEGITVQELNEEHQLRLARELGGQLLGQQMSSTNCF